MDPPESREVGVALQPTTALTTPAETAAAAVAATTTAATAAATTTTSTSSATSIPNAAVDADSPPESDEDAHGFGLPFILNYWKEFDLETARVSLDEQGLRIAENQEGSLKNRRKLAEATRDFKKASSTDQTRLFVSLLKAYQEEVDNLTKRAKFGEAAFLGIYQKLYEAPDPVPALESAADSSSLASDLTSANQRLLLELAEYHEESKHLRNQQATVRRLEERNRQLEQQMEDKVREVVSMKHQVLAEESTKSMEALREREESLQDQLRLARASVNNMQRLHEISQSQLFELRAQSEEHTAAKEGEVNLLTDEVERAQSRLMALEREKETLKARLQTAQADGMGGEGESDNDPNSSSSSSSISIISSAGLESALRAKESVISSLHAELHAVEAAAAAEREEHRGEVKRLQASWREKEEALASLKTELASRPTQKQWEDLRRQCKILQAVGYNAVEVDGWDDETSTAADDATKQQFNSYGSSSSSSGIAGGGGGAMGRLESLLLEKNKKVEHELTQVKFKLSESQSVCEAQKGQLASLEATVAEQRALIGRLEDDILKGYSATEKRAASGGNLGGMASSASAAAAGAAGSSTDAGAAAASAASPGVASPLDDDNSVLMVVCGQRDRFRQRMGELEEELRVAQDQISKLTADVDRLKADNVKLYERIRYVQNYTNSGGSGGSGVSVGSSSNNTNSSSERANAARARKVDLEMGPSSDVENKYRKMYEENINPFAAFSNKEREQRVRDLGFRDRITLSGGKFLLSNKFARTFVFFYSIGLHIIVALSMYRLSSISHASIKMEEAELPMKHTLLAAAIRSRNITQATIRPS